MGLPPFVLASASPARLRLLQTAGIDPIVSPSDFDESQVQIDDPITLVQHLAQKKAERVASHFEDALIMGCDSVLALSGEILIDQTQSLTLARCQITQVYFAWVSDRQIEAYVATGEPLNCAGSFALEGKGGLFVEKIEGCHSNVIGLSLPLLRQMLSDLGYDPIEFWQ